MADKKISQLPSGNLDANSIFPIVTNGITSQTSFSDVVEALDPYFSGGGQDLQGVMTEGSLYFDMVNKKGLSIQGLEGIEQLAILAGKSQVMVSKDGFGIMAGASLFSPTSNYTLLEGDVVADKALVFTLPTSTKNSGIYTLATLDDIPSGGTQDLQSVLDNGNIASFGTNSQNAIAFSLETGVDESRRSYIIHSNLDNTVSTLFGLQENSFSVVQVYNDLQALFSVQEGLINMQQSDADGSRLFTLPTKPVGDYTLATTDDITGVPNLQQVLAVGDTSEEQNINLKTSELGAGGAFITTDYSNNTSINLATQSYHTNNTTELRAGFNNIEFFIGKNDTFARKYAIRAPEVDGKVNLIFPVKSDGDYTIATLDDIKIGTTAPTSATATGTVGEIRVTPTFIYTCVATNTWVRAAVATW